MILNIVHQLMKSPRNIQFTVISVFVFALFHETLKDLLLFSYSSQLFLYIMFIPLVSAYFLYDKRKKVFFNLSYSVFPGSVVALTGLIVYIMGKVWRPQFTQTEYLSVMTLSALSIWLGGFIALYGLRTFKKAAFPLCFLFLMIPIPNAVLDQSMVILQKGSADAADLFFKMVGVPAYREGFVFSLSNQKFEIARDCTGIRSFVYLFITSLIFGRLFIGSVGRRVLLMLFVLPITIVQNTFRVVTLALTGNYLNMSVFKILHGYGGLPFVSVAMGLLIMVVWCLHKTEKQVTPQENA